MKFILDHLLLIAIVVLSGGALLVPGLRGGGRRSSTTEVTQLINRGKTTILDVRDDAEYGSGHLRDAKHIPLADLPNRVGELEKSKSKTVVVVCQSGNRAEKAVKTLEKAGFTDVTIMDGGMAAWQSAGLPVAK